MFKREIVRKIGEYALSFAVGVVAVAVTLCFLALAALMIDRFPAKDVVGSVFLAIMPVFLISTLTWLVHDELFGP